MRRRSYHSSIVGLLEDCSFFTVFSTRSLLPRQRGAPRGELGRLPVLLPQLEEEGRFAAKSEEASWIGTRNIRYKGQLIKDIVQF